MADAPDTLFGADVSMAARLLGALLWRYAPHGDEQPFVWPAVRTLADQLKTDTRRVRRLFIELKSEGLLREQKRQIGGRDLRGWVLLGRANRPSQEGAGTRVYRPSQEGTEDRGGGSLDPGGRANRPSESPLKPHRSQRREGEGPAPRGRHRGVIGLAEQEVRPENAEQLLERHGAELRRRYPAYDGTHGPDLLDKVTGLWPAYERAFAASGPTVALAKLRGWLSEDYARANTAWLRAGNLDVAAIAGPVSRTGKPRPREEPDP